ncbi:MAG: DUF169 domain-containing protein [Candidatus Omnitrophota bacterium]|nr:MAG: DUF169 domain-containing protein [Candidatus Omnitrophota bacterium]
MESKVWQTYSLMLKEVLDLSLSPVGVCYIEKKGFDVHQGKVRICRAILDAASGKSLYVCRENNACFGAAWHLGFHKMRDSKVFDMTKKFIVEGEKLFSSYKALDTLLAQMQNPPDNSNMCFQLSPLEKTEQKPQLVIFVCTPHVACRLLTLAMFLDGIMPKIKIGGPTCKMAIIYPLFTGEVNVSFYDYTARKMCNVEKDKLLVSIPYKRIPQIIESIDKCTAGRAKMEFPQEFREFLQKRLAK